MMVMWLHKFMGMINEFGGKWTHPFTLPQMEMNEWKGGGGELIQSENW